MTLAEQIQLQLKDLPTDKQVEVLDFIAFLRQRAQAARSAHAEEERGKRIQASLQKLAELGTFADIKDPVEWQRQLRKDRPLPGREE